MNIHLSSIPILLSIPLLLLVAFLFTAAEVAFFSLSRQQVAKWHDDNDAILQRIARLFDHPRELLLTTIVGYTGAVAFFFAAVMLLSKQIAESSGIEVAFGYILGLLIAIPIFLAVFYHD